MDNQRRGLSWGDNSLSIIINLCFVLQVFLEFAKRQLEEGQSEKEVELGRQLSRALSVEGKHERDSSSYRL